VFAVVEHGLAGRIGIGQRRGVDVDHHLVTLARRARVDAVMEGRLREQRQRVGLLLLERGRVLDGHFDHTRFRGNGQRLHE